MGQKHVLCVENVLCAAVGTVSHQHGLEAYTVCVENVLLAAVVTASRQHGLEACTLYAERTVYSCRHSNSSS